jgi:hypothetical protein
VTRGGGQRVIWPCSGGMAGGALAVGVSDLLERDEI